MSDIIQFCHNATPLSTKKAPTGKTRQVLFIIRYDNNIIDLMNNVEQVGHKKNRMVTNFERAMLEILQDTF